MTFFKKIKYNHDIKKIAETMQIDPHHVTPIERLAILTVYVSTNISNKHKIFGANKYTKYDTSILTMCFAHYLCSTGMPLEEVGHFKVHYSHFVKQAICTMFGIETKISSEMFRERFKNFQHAMHLVFGDPPEDPTALLETFYQAIIRDLNNQYEPIDTPLIITDIFDSYTIKTEIMVYLKSLSGLLTEHIKLVIENPY